MALIVDACSRVLLARGEHVVTLLEAGFSAICRLLEVNALDIAHTKNVGDVDVLGASPGYEKFIVLGFQARVVDVVVARIPAEPRHVDPSIESNLAVERLVGS